MRHGVEADHVGGAIGRALAAADRRTRERVDLVEAELERGRVVHRREHREDAHAVGDEIRRVLGADHALAERRGEERLEAIEDRRVGVGRGNQLDQAHVARRIEEMDADEALAQFLRQRLREL